MDWNSFRYLPGTLLGAAFSGCILGFFAVALSSNEPKPRKLVNGSIVFWLFLTMGGPNFEGSVAVWMVAIASCILFSVHALTGDFDNLRSD